MGRWHEDSRDYKITQCNTQTNLGSMKQPYELSSFMAKYTCRNMVRKFEGWNCCIHVLYIQKRCISYLIIILNLVFLFIIIPTLSQLTYLFLGEVAALFNRNLAGYCATCV